MRGNSAGVAVNEEQLSARMRSCCSSQISFNTQKGSMAFGSQLLERGRVDKTSNFLPRRLHRLDSLQHVEQGPGLLADGVQKQRRLEIFELGADVVHKQPSRRGKSAAAGLVTNSLSSALTSSAVLPFGTNEKTNKKCERNSFAMSRALQLSLPPWAPAALASAASESFPLANERRVCKVSRNKRHFSPLFARAL